MIQFVTEDFILDLSDVRLTLVEENPIFYNYFVKKYALPFTLKLDDKTSKTLGFIGLEGATDYKTKHAGQLVIENEFYPANIVFSGLASKRLKGTIYYGLDTLPVFETALTALPFPLIKTDNIYTHAKAVLEKSYPEVGYNFPMVLDPEFSAEDKYQKFEGIRNHYHKDGYFLKNIFVQENGKRVAHNKNLMVPYPYLLEVIKTGFQSEGYTIMGDFVADPAVQKLIVVTSEYLESFYSDLPSGFSFKTGTEYYKDGNVFASFEKIYHIGRKGAYFIRLFYNLPRSFQGVNFTIKKGGETLFSSNSISVNTILNLPVIEDEDLGHLRFYLEFSKAVSDPDIGIGSIADFNSFSFSFSDGELNEFPKAFSVSDVLPDISFGTFLNRIKNWLNLQIKVRGNIVFIDYVKSVFSDLEYQYQSKNEVRQNNKNFNRHKLYKLKSGKKQLFVSASGRVPNQKGVAKNDVIPIEMNLSLLEIAKKGEVYTGTIKYQENDFSLVLYDGLVGGLPLCRKKVMGRDFSLDEIYRLFWEQWLQFRLNSETINDEFLTQNQEGYNLDKGMFKYGCLHIIKKIKKTRKKSDGWLVKTEYQSLR